MSNITTAATHTGRTTRSRRVGQALALFVAPWCFVVANLGDALTSPNGLDDTTSRGALEISATHPLADKWLTFAAMLGCLLLIPAVLGAMSLVRVGAARLGLIGGVLMIAGYVCYFGMLFQGFATIALAEHGGVTADHVAVLDLTINQPFFIAVALTFVLGNIVGTFLLGLALVRSRAVPRWAGLAVIAWPVLHILGGSWGEVLGAALQAVGFAVVGHRLLRADAAGSGTSSATAPEASVAPPLAAP
ncbi:hypothetical protein ACPPVT_19830 [Angustibacter sp. McL0619]|uniref:hypothetical protein n=1 Tax=Angustibacter sp. McL0619 TaxID=3415676 RepID=UPI003CEA7978